MLPAMRVVAVAPLPLPLWLLLLSLAWSVCPPSSAMGSNQALAAEPTAALKPTPPSAPTSLTPPAATAPAPAGNLSQPGSGPSAPVAPPSPTSRPANGKRNLVVLGDSLAAGYGVDPTDAWPARLQSRIDAAQLPFRIVNAGVSGDTTAGGLRRLDWVLKQPVDVLFIELGGNDGLRGMPPAATRSNLTAIITRARQRSPETGIVLAGMQMPPSMGPDYTTPFAAVFPELAKEHQAALIPHLLEGVGGVPELNQPDLIHPTPEGHDLVASNAWRVLEPFLRQRSPAPTPR
jgi:acyl-CoA thioesterase-1